MGKNEKAEKATQDVDSQARRVGRGEEETKIIKNPTVNAVLL